MRQRLTDEEIIVQQELRTNPAARAAFIKKERRRINCWAFGVFVLFLLFPPSAFFTLPFVLMLHIHIARRARRYLNGERWV